MQMEMEFEDDVLAAHGKAYRLENYMAKFKEYGVWENAAWLTIRVITHCLP